MHNHNDVIRTNSTDSRSSSANANANSFDTNYNNANAASQAEAIHASHAHQHRLLLTLSLTATVFFAEVIGSFMTNSLSLLIDAGHMLTDISVLAASTVTAILMRRRPNSKRTWGWARLEIITAAAGALILLLVGCLLYTSDAADE